MLPASRKMIKEHMSELMPPSPKLRSCGRDFRELLLELESCVAKFSAFHPNPRRKDVTI